MPSAFSKIASDTRVEPNFPVVTRDVLRYWAIMGLRSQYPETLQPFSQTILDALDDEYPLVAVMASAVAYELSGNKTAADNMEKWCSAENSDISLMAINSLLYLSNKEPFVETIWKVKEMNDRNYNIAAACLDFLGSMGLVPNNPDYRD